MLRLRFYPRTNARCEGDIIAQALRASRHHRCKLKETFFQVRKNGRIGWQGIAGHLIEHGVNFGTGDGDPGTKTLAARRPCLVEIIFEFNPELILFPDEGFPSSAARSRRARLGNQQDKIAQRHEDERANQPFADPRASVVRVVGLHDRTLRQGCTATKEI